MHDHHRYEDERRDAGDDGAAGLGQGGGASAEHLRGEGPGLREERQETSTAAASTASQARAFTVDRARARAARSWSSRPRTTAPVRPARAAGRCHGGPGADPPVEAGVEDEEHRSAEEDRRRDGEGAQHARCAALDAVIRDRLLEDRRQELPYRSRVTPWWAASEDLASMTRRSPT